MDLIDITRTYHPNTARIHIFSSECWTFSKTDHILGHKINLNKYRKIKTASSIFFGHNSMKLEIKFKETGKHKHLDITNCFIYYKHELLSKSKGKLKKYLETSGNRNTMVQTLWDKVKAVLEEFQRETTLTEKTKCDQLYLSFK